MKMIADALAKTLMTVDAQNQAHYQKKLDDFNDKWSQAIGKWQHQTQSLRGKTIVVNHNSWAYLEDWLKLERVATLEPKSGVAPSSSHLAQVLAQMMQNQADMILYATYQNDKAVRWLTKNTDIPAVALPFSVANDESIFQWYEKLLNQLLEVR